MADAKAKFSQLPEPVQVLFAEIIKWLKQADVGYTTVSHFGLTDTFRVVGLEGGQFYIRWVDDCIQLGKGTGATTSTYQFQLLWVGLDDPDGLTKIRAWILDQVTQQRDVCQAAAAKLGDKLRRLQGTTIGENSNPQ